METCSFCRVLLHVRNYFAMQENYHYLLLLRGSTVSRGLLLAVPGARGGMLSWALGCVPARSTLIAQLRVEQAGELCVRTEVILGL